MSALLTAASLQQPRRAWETEARCAPGIDYTAIDSADDPAYGSAVAACHECPVLAECRVTALGVTNYAGLAGGLLEAQRVAWRKRHRVTVKTSARDYLPPEVAEQDRGYGEQLAASTVAEVARQLAAGEWRNDQIARRLGIPLTTVKHARHIIGERAAGRRR